MPGAKTSWKQNVTMAAHANKSMENPNILPPFGPCLPFAFWKRLITCHGPRASHKSRASSPKRGQKESRLPAAAITHFIGHCFAVPDKKRKHASGTQANKQKTRRKNAQSGCVNVNSSEIKGPKQQEQSNPRPATSETEKTTIPLTSWMSRWPWVNAFTSEIFPSCRVDRTPTTN